MPARWEPWPANRNAVRPVTGAPSRTLPAPSPFSSAASPSSASPPATAARRSNCARVVASADATSASGTSGLAASQVRRRAAWPRSASSVLAGQDERQQRRGDAGVARGGRAGIALGGRDRGALGAAGSARLADGGRRFLDDHVRVGAADAERGHAGAAGAPAARPRLGLGQQPHRARLPVHVRRGLVGVQRRRQLLVPQRHDHLDHAADPRRGLRVAEVGLQRAEPQRLVLAVLPVGRQQRLRPRSDRPGSCPCRAPRRRRRRPARARRWPAPRGSRAPATGRWAPSGRCWPRPG